MAQFWTIENPDGPYTFDHPQIPGGKPANLFHDRPVADETIAHAENTDGLTICEVSDREEWGERIVALGITHVHEHILDSYDQTYQSDVWLANLRLLRIGRKTDPFRKT